MLGKAGGWLWLVSVVVFYKVEMSEGFGQINTASPVSRALLDTLNLKGRNYIYIYMYMYINLSTVNHMSDSSGSIPRDR